MDNELIKNIVEQFPSLALFLGCLGAFVWLIKSVMEIKSKNYVSKLNKEVLSITLSSVKSKELIENLKNLQEIVSDLESSSKIISDRVFYVELTSLNDALTELVKNLPDDWKFRNELTIQQDWLADFFKLNESATTAIEGSVGKDEKAFHFSTEQLSRKSTSVFFAIDELINLTARYKEKAQSTVDWVATAKGAGALCILVFFSYGLVSTVNLQEELAISSTMLAEQSQTYERVMSSFRLERDEAVTRYTASAQKIERLTQELAAIKKDEKEDEEPDSIDSEFIIKMNWRKPADLDLMLRLPNDKSISYQRSVANEYEGRLINDIQTGPGEETIIIKRSQPGLYEIIVTNYSRNGEIDFEIKRFADGVVVWKEIDKVNEHPRRYRFKIE